MDESAIEIDAPDAASAAYIRRELIGHCDAELVAPSRAAAAPRSGFGETAANAR